MADQKICIDQGLLSGSVLKSGEKQNQYKVLRYYRFKDAKIKPKRNTNTPPEQRNLFAKDIKAEKVPDAVLKFNQALVFSYANALIGKILASKFPWGKLQKYRTVYRDYDVVSTATTNYNDDRQLARTLRYVTLPPGNYTERIEPSTGLAAFQSWYRVFAMPLKDPTSRWFNVYEELKNNWQNYVDITDVGDEGAELNPIYSIYEDFVKNILKQVQKLAQGK